MRRLTLGVDGEGRSCVIDVVDVAPAPGAHGVNVARVHATAESPPPPDPEAGPTTSTTIHHGDALDLVFVHEGSGDLMLQDGPLPVAAGDCIVMPGVDHAIRTGPNGIRLVVVTVGTPPPVPA